MTDLERTLTELRKDLTNCQVKLSEALRQLSELKLAEPEEDRCPTCGVRLRGPLSLAEHLYTSHAGPVPEHYTAAERAAGLAA